MPFSVKPILDRNGNVLAQIMDSASIEGNQTLLSRSGDVKGTYNVTMNITLDRSGNVIGRGNLLGMLIK